MNRRPLNGLLLLAVLAVAAFLRMHNLTDNPGWYADEATHVNIAANLLDGEIRYLAITDSTLVFARLPLFELLLAASSGVIGVGIDTVRTLTAALGVVSVGLVYGLVRASGRNTWFALVAALVLAIYPDAVLYSRIGYSYALLAPLVLLTCLGFIRYWTTSQRVWLVFAALMVGLGLISDLAMGSFLPAVALLILANRPVDVLWALPLCLLPFGIYAMVMLFTVPDAFLLDLRFTLGRLNVLTPAEQIDTVIQNYTVHLESGYWFPLGVVGMFFLRPARLAWVVGLMFFVSFFMLGRTVALFQLSFYYMIPYLPLVALGVAALVYTGGQRLWRQTAGSVPQRIGGLALLLLVVGIPLGDTMKHTLDSVNDGFETEIAPFLVTGEDARQAAAFINARTQPDDLVIASPAIAWMIDANATDAQMSIAYDGVETVHLPGEMPLDRFAFDPRFERARYVVVDDIWRHWTVVHIPDVDVWWATIQDEWSAVFTSGAVTVYQSPK